MNCCTNCFRDTELKGFIFDNTLQKGNCDYCHSTDVELLDPRELEEMFLPVVSIYQTISKLGITVTDGKLLNERMQEDWNLFAISETNISHRLIVDIISGTYPPDSPILTEPVAIAALHRDGALSDEHEKKWENFAEEIKSSNRFFLQETIDLKLLNDLLRVLKKNYSRGKIFYRARISGKDGLQIAEMGKPPADKTTAGRANPKGIPYLYVSATQKTTEYECRSSYLDYLTVGTFKLTDTLSVISLRDTQKISPFVLEANVENYVVHQKYLARLEKELSKPIRRFDKELDYLPTQYLCEYVKSLNYDAIEYGSALHKDGINLAIFNDSKIECKSVEVFEVDSMELHLERVIAS